MSPSFQCNFALAQREVCIVKCYQGLEERSKRWERQANRRTGAVAGPMRAAASAWRAASAPAGGAAASRRHAGCSVGRAACLAGVGPRPEGPTAGPGPHCPGRGLQRASEGFLEMRPVMSTGRCAMWGCSEPLYTCGPEGEHQKNLQCIDERRQKDDGRRGARGSGCSEPV